MKPHHNAGASLSLAFLLISSSAGAASLTALGMLPSPSPASRALAVTPDGRFVVGDSNSGTGLEAFRWSRTEGMVGLGDLPDGELWSAATAISADGGTVFGAALVGDSGPAYVPFRWTSGVGLQRLNGLLPVGFLQAGAKSTTPDGLVVVGTLLRESGHGQAFRWTEAEGYMLLGQVPDDAVGTVGVAVSADGQVVAGHSDSIGGGGVEGFRWTTETGMVGLGRQARGQPVLCEVYGMSANGDFITGLVQYQQGNLEMMRWSTEEGLVPLGHFPGGESRSIGYGVTDDGRMVVGEAIVEVIEPGFPFPLRQLQAAVWRQGVGLTALWDLLKGHGVDPAADGWTSLFELLAVSGDGRYLVGAGRRDGISEAFLADLAPKLEIAPTAGTLLLSWPANFRLQRTGSLSPAAWSDLPDAVSPWELPAGSEDSFFRLVSAL